MCAKQLSQTIKTIKFIKTCGCMHEFKIWVIITGLAGAEGISFSMFFYC